MIYATKEDLTLWLGLDDISFLPENVDKLIINASRVIDHATMGQINTANTKHAEVAKNATTAQCEYWIDGVGESADITPSVSGYSAGKFSVQFNGGSMPKLAPRARRELWLGGLLNRRVVSI
jgi:hypothetical protein